MNNPTVFYTKQWSSDIGIHIQFIKIHFNSILSYSLNTFRAACFPLFIHKGTPLPGLELAPRIIRLFF